MNLVDVKFNTVLQAARLGEKVLSLYDNNRIKDMTDLQQVLIRDYKENKAMDKVELLVKSVYTV